MPRKTAYLTLLKIDREAAFSHITLDQALESAALSPVDRALATRLVYTTLTWLPALDTLIARFLKQPISTLDPEVLTLLRLGACQARFMDRIPEHAIVNELVEISHEVMPAASGMVNAVLRRIVRDKKPWYDDTVHQSSEAKKPAKWLAARYALPTWLANRLIQQFKGESDQVAAKLTTIPPLYLRRVRVGKTPASASSDHSNDTAKNEVAPTAPKHDDGKSSENQLVTPVTSPTTVPQAYIMSGGSLGAILSNHAAWTVQDLGSQLVGWFAMPAVGSRCIDGCAGLGGKTLQLLDAASSLVAVDPNGSKLELLRESEQLRGMISEKNAKIVVENINSMYKIPVNKGIEGEKMEKFSTFEGTLQEYAATKPAPCDHLLLDAPCSGLGVIRRHPEVKWHRKESDIQSLTEVQRELLDVAATLVCRGGTLVYSVCTFTVEETKKQVDGFLQRHRDWELEPNLKAKLREISDAIDWEVLLEDGKYLVLYPHRHNTDGFFAARFIRQN